MIKRAILLAAALATCSFATWDYFGVSQESQGAVKAGIYYDTDNDWSQMGIKASARFNASPKLELSIQGFGLQFWGETECDQCEEGGAGLRDMTIGGRYTMNPMLSLFIDFNLPIGKDSPTSGSRTPPSKGEIFLYFGGQYHNKIESLKGFSFGTEAGFFWGFEHHDLERGLELRLGGELDYKLTSAPVTVLFGSQLWIRIFNSERKVNGRTRTMSDDWSNQWKFWVGANFAVTNNISINAQAIFRSQDLESKPRDGGVEITMEGDAKGVTLDVEFKF